MPGEFKYTALNTVATQTADPKLALAFCAGRDSRIAGVSTNPFVATDENYTAWQAGYDTITPEGLVDNCASCIPITIPNIVGMTYVAATAALAAKYLKIGDITNPLGVVTVQSPAFGSGKVQRNVTVNVTLAAVVPNIVGLTPVAAGAALVAAFLIPGVITGTTGLVTVQSPVPTTVVAVGSAVAYTVSETVPNLVGQAPAAATTLLTTNHLIAGTIVGTTGLVTVQSPAAATKVLAGSAVGYTISETVPSIIGLDATNANIAILAQHFIVGTVTGGPGGVVTIQSPVATTKALAGTAVNYTLV